MKSLSVRSKANWAANGKKNTKYFLNLEKRNYTDKLMSKLILEDSQEITEQADIINARRSFYETLYSSREPCLNPEHLFTFFNEDYQRPKLNIEENMMCEGEISWKKCIDALEDMSEGKRPGIDGFTPGPGCSKAD